MATSKLGFGLTFSDLSRAECLQRLDDEFLKRLAAINKSVHDDLCASRAATRTLTPIEVSNLIIAGGPVLEEIIGELFGIQDALDHTRAATLSHNPVFAFKKLFVQRRARRRLSLKEPIEEFSELDRWLDGCLKAERFSGLDRELAIARFGAELLAESQANAEGIEKLTRWCIRALVTPEGQATVKGWVSFHMPQPTDHQQLVPIKLVKDPAGRIEGQDQYKSHRDGFDLTDPRMPARSVMSEVNYCIYCHDHDGDFCSKGFPQKKGEPEQGLKINPLGSTLTGCPLEEKISEMHALKRDGYTIGALAAAMVDNPMVPATGHRICNDCMKSCIYQKQDPVNIPEIETGSLVDVLELPWGVEIYDLLTKWNPLRPRQWLLKPYNGLKVLVAGMGPAGFTLSHHLLMEGFAVVGIDGLKIEPLPQELLTTPIEHYSEIRERLDERVLAGFGGVSEYGITVRWDKNFLKLIYLTLSRRPHFQVFGGVRFGGTLTVEDAWTLGFDHVGIALGAGTPRTLPIVNSLARGMRQAVDFLMALQLTGAVKANSLTNIQVRLPAVVIGGGLTGIDTATEVQAYYLLQVEKILTRYERLSQTLGESRVRDQLDQESAGVLEEFLAHGRAVRAERERARAEGRKPDLIGLVRAWGGVTVVYRRAMNESPAYLRNHEEIGEALKEGIYYAEALDPVAAVLDRFSHVQTLVCRRQIRDADGKWVASDEEIELPARAIFVAAGSSPNIIYHYERRGTFKLEGNHFQPHRPEADELVPVPVRAHCKSADFGPFTSYNQDGHRVSFVGDTHPVFKGSVVKAIASAKRTYPHIVASLGERASARGDVGEYAAFRARMADLLTPTVVSVQRLSPTVVEVRVRAPMAARNFKPGQFFRMQNFERRSPLIENTRLQTEALAITGAGVDDNGVVSLVIVEVGASSRLCATLRPGDPIVLMGPTGVATQIVKDQTVMIVGGRRAGAVARTVGAALRTAGSRVLYIAGFQTADEVYWQDDLEESADAILWVTAAGAPVEARRPHDRSATGDFIETLSRYAAGELHDGAPPIPLNEVDRIIIIGTNRLVRAMNDARKEVLRPYLVKSPQVVASISGPMQCMMKGVCSQCLQWQVDPATGKRTKAVFACSWQDQPIDIVDLDNLDARLSQNVLQERLANLWLDYLFAHNEIERA